MLTSANKFVLSTKGKESVVNATFHQLACNTSQGNRPINYMDRQEILFLKTGTTEACFQIAGMTPVYNERLKLIDRGKLIIPAVVLKNKQVVHSGPPPPLALRF
jgi:hypothetical protein